MAVVAGSWLGKNCLNVCTGELNRKITLEERIIKAPGMGKTKSTVVFNVVGKLYSKIDTPRGVARVSGVNTDIEITHLFLVRWTKKLHRLDGQGEHFIRYDNYLYRIHRVANYAEQNKWLQFQCTERGNDAKEESSA